METLDLYNCTVNTNCDEFSASEYCWSCVYISSPPPSLPPPPPPHLSSQNHLTPYLVTGVCVLGVAFLILTTCAILLRWRWSRRRNSVSSPSSRDEVFLDEDHIGPVDHPIWRIVTVGLPDSVIDSITAFKYKKGDGLIEGTDCSVCLTEFEEGDELRLLPKCSHAFHLNCVDTWLRSHKNCPLCRAPVVNDSSVQNLTGLGPNLIEPGSSGSARMGMGILEGDQDELSEGGGTSDDGVGDSGCALPLGGIMIGEILKNNWGNRALSDLGGNRRVQSGDLRPVRRSISLDVSAAAAINNAVAVNVGGEGSSNQSKLAEVKEMVEQDCRECGSSMSRLMKSSSIGRSLQKAPVSMKRSFSSSARILSSFRGSKRHSSSSILPL